MPKRIKDGAYVINLDKYSLYVKNIEIIYFYSFSVEHVPKGIKNFIGYKNIKTNIFIVQANNSIIMCGYFCFEYLDFVIAGKTLIYYTCLFLS